MKKTLVIGLAALIPGGIAQAGDLTFSSDLTFASEYIFRGIQYGDNSLQPSIEVAQDQFYAGLWVQQPIENRDSLGWGDEFDFYAGYTPQLSDNVSLDLGATHYYYPTSTSTTEVFAGANFAAGGFTPGIYLYYDFGSGDVPEKFTAQGNLGFSIPLDELGTSLDLSGYVGHVNPDAGESYTYYGFGASLPYKLNQHTTLKVGVNWAKNDLDDEILAALGNDDDDHLWFTAGITVGF